MRFLASVEAAHTWRREHPDALLLTIDEGFALGREVSHLRLGEALAAGPLAEPPGLP